MPSTIDSDPLVEKDMVQVECLYGNFDKMQNGPTPTKEQIVSALGWISERYRFKVIPKDDDVKEFSNIDNWRFVSYKDYDDFLKLYAKTKSCGRKALIRILDIQIRFLENSCKDKAEFYGHMLTMTKLIRPSCEAKLDVRALTTTDIETAIENKIKTLNLSNNNIRTDKLKSFGGKNSTLSWTEFEFQIDEIVRINNVHESRIIGIVVPLLEDNALNEYRSLHKMNENDLDRIDWHEIKRHFQNIFKDENEQRRLREQLLNLTAKKNQNLNEYLAEFNELRLKIRDYPEQELKHLFIRGLHRKMREKILEKKPYDLKETISLATFFQSIHESSQVGYSEHEANFSKMMPRQKENQILSRNSNRNSCGSNRFQTNDANENFDFANHGEKVVYKNSYNENRYNSDKDRYFKGPNKDLSTRYERKNHTPNYIQDYRNNYPPRPNDMKCFKCKRPGHKAVDCSVRSQTNYFAKREETVNRVQIQGSNFDDFEDEPQIAYMIDIGSLEQIEQTRLMQTDAKINDNLDDCEIDIEATTSITSLNVANECNLKIFEDKTRIQLANNSLSKVADINEIGSVQTNSNKSVIIEQRDLNPPDPIHHIANFFENFPDQHIIENYSQKKKSNHEIVDKITDKRLNQRFEEIKPIQSRPSRQNLLCDTINLSLCRILYWLAISFLLIFPLKRCKSLDINSILHYNFYKDCDFPKENETNNPEWQETAETMKSSVFILNRLSHEKSGLGLECVVKIVEQKCSMLWLGSKEPCTYTTVYKENYPKIFKFKFSFKRINIVKNAKDEADEFIRKKDKI
jgi:hypothetical protein